MTKTKRQLRAEAVERLSNYEEWHKKEKERHEDPDLLMAVIGGDSWGCTWQENRDALIDLLTDDEPTTAVNLYETSKRINSECESDGDAVSIMRNAQSKLLAPDVDFPEVPNAPASAVSSGNESGDAQERIIEQQQSTIDALLARTEQLEQVIQADKDDCEQAFADIARLTAERDALARDLHAEHALVVQLQSDVERLQGERDEWKAKTEQFANANSPAENDVSSGRVDANDANLDSREKLEADVRKWCEESNAVFPKSRFMQIVRWLDRQAAITERDAFMRGRASLDDEFAELEADCTTAEREEDRLRGEVADLEDKLQAQNRMVTQLLFERDAYRDKCGRMLDAIHEAERVMSE